MSESKDFLVHIYYENMPEYKKIRVRGRPNSSIFYTVYFPASAMSTEIYFVNFGI